MDYWHSGMYSIAFMGEPTSFTPTTCNYCQSASSEGLRTLSMLQKETWDVNSLFWNLAASFLARIVVLRCSNVLAVGRLLSRFCLPSRVGLERAR